MRPRPEAAALRADPGLVAGNEFNGERAGGFSTGFAEIE
jgi:hypothetical protein